MSRAKEDVRARVQAKEVVQAKVAVIRSPMRVAEASRERSAATSDQVEKVILII